MRALLYPLLLSSTVGLALLGAHLGLAPGAALMAALLTLFGVILALERLIPQVGAWNRSPDARLDAGHTLAALGTERLVRLPFEAGVVALAGGGALASWSLPAQVLALLLAPDALKYGVHRLSHRWDPLWGVHAVHHQPRRVALLNGLRMHPLNVAWNVAPDAALLLIAGPSPEAALVAGAIRGAVALLQHANVDLRSGWLSPWLSTPEAHRWHHVRDRVASDVNFGATSLVWDWLFGTWRAPEPAPLDVGIDEELPRGYAGQMLWPLCRDALRTRCFTANARRWLA